MATRTDYLEPAEQMKCHNITRNLTPNYGGKSNANTDLINVGDGYWRPTGLVRRPNI